MSTDVIDLCSNGDDKEIRTPLQEVVVRRNQRGATVTVARSKRQSRPPSSRVTLSPFVLSHNYCRLSPTNKENQSSTINKTEQEPVVSKRQKTETSAKPIDATTKTEDKPQANDAAAVERSPDKCYTETTFANEDDECIIVGQKGNNALSDFPHSREDCVVHPSDCSDNKDHCPKCFCFVCDVTVKDCQHWNVHCIARFKHPVWKKERDTKARDGDEYVPTDMARLLSRVDESGPALRQYAARVVKEAQEQDQAAMYARLAARQTPAPDSTVTSPHYAHQRQQLPCNPQFQQQYVHNLATPVHQPYYGYQPQPPHYAQKQQLRRLYDQQYQQQDVQYTPAPRDRQPYYGYQPQQIPSPQLQQQLGHMQPSFSLYGANQLHQSYPPQHPALMAPVSATRSTLTTIAVAVQMTALEQLASDEAVRFYRHTLRQWDRTAPTYLTCVETNLVRPLSMSHISGSWNVEHIAHSSKIHALISYLAQAREANPMLSAVVFCQDFRWRQAIAMVLAEQQYQVTHVNTCFAQGRFGSVCIESTYSEQTTLLPDSSIVYFMEPCTHMLWEENALRRIVPNTPQPLQIVKFYFEHSVEENVVDFQDAVLAGRTTIEPNTLTVDGMGVSILLNGLQ